MGGIESYKKTVMRAVRLFNNACGEKIGEQIGGEKITVLLPTSLPFFCLLSTTYLFIVYILST